MSEKFSVTNGLRSDVGLGEPNPSLIIGAAMSIGLIVLLATIGPRSLTRYFDIPSLVLVLGGSVVATLIHCSLENVKYAYRLVSGQTVSDRDLAPERISYLVGLSQAVRDQGALILERESKLARDPFLGLALELAVDGNPDSECRSILETEMSAVSERLGRAAQVFQTMGGYAPAMGLIGTLIGLIQLLEQIQNPAALGPAMSLAMVSTLYGALLANLVFLPLAGRVRNRGDQDIYMKLLTIEGVVSLARRESPIVIEQRLRSFLNMQDGESDQSFVSHGRRQPSNRTGGFALLDPTLSKLG